MSWLRIAARPTRIDVFLRVSTDTPCMMSYVFPVLTKRLTLRKMNLSPKWLMAKVKMPQTRPISPRWSRIKLPRFTVMRRPWSLKPCQLRCIFYHIRLTLQGRKPFCTSANSPYQACRWSTFHSNRPELQLYMRWKSPTSPLAVAAIGFADILLLRTDLVLPNAGIAG